MKPANKDLNLDECRVPLDENDDPKNWHSNRDKKEYKKSRRSDAPPASGCYDKKLIVVGWRTVLSNVQSLMLFFFVYPHTDGELNDREYDD